MYHSAIVFYFPFTSAVRPTLMFYLLYDTHAMSYYITGLSRSSDENKILDAPARTSEDRQNSYETCIVLHDGMMGCSITVNCSRLGVSLCNVAILECRTARFRFLYDRQCEIRPVPLQCIVGLIVSGTARTRSRLAILRTTSSGRTRPWPQGPACVS